MELVVNYPFTYNHLYYSKTGVIGNFNDVSWSFAFNYIRGRFCLKITCSNPSRSFAIMNTFSVLYAGVQMQNECDFKYINDGEANVLFPFNLNNGWPLIHFSGSITILQLPVYSSKETTVSSISLTECNPPSTKKFKPSPQLSEEILRLLNNPDTFPDATLKCGAEEFLVHKNILSGRSPVFDAMFKNEMQESSSGIVEIVDIEPNVLQATLEYVYSGKTDHLDDGIAGDVLYAANKYQLEELKKVCIDKLKSSMTVDNVFRFLVLGDLHDASLKLQAKEFVCKCDLFSNLENTEGWKSLQSEYPGLAMEVLQFALKDAQHFLAENAMFR